MIFWCEAFPLIILSSLSAKSRLGFPRSSQNPLPNQALIFFPGTGTVACGRGKYLALQLLVMARLGAGTSLAST